MDNGHLMSRKDGAQDGAASNRPVFHQHAPPTNRLLLRWRRAGHRQTDRVLLSSALLDNGHLMSRTEEGRVA